MELDVRECSRFHADRYAKGPLRGWPSVWQWLTRAADEDTVEEQDIESCPHCRKQLRPRRLVKMQWFRERQEPLRGALERVGNSAGGEQDDLNLPQDGEPKPQFTVGQFTLRNFRPQQIPARIFSQEVVDDLGSIWRLEVFPRGEWISAYITLNKGLEGRYEYIIETLNNFPKRLRFESNFKQRSSFGSAEFIDTRPIPGDAAPININFRYFVRPVSFDEKCKLQQKLLDKLDKQDGRLKG